MGNIGRPELSSGTGVIRRRGWDDGRDFLDVLASIDDVTSSAAPEKKAQFITKMLTGKYQRIISNNSYTHDKQGDNPGQE